MKLKFARLLAVGSLLFGMLVSSSGRTDSGDLKIDASMLKFSYQVFEGEGDLACTHVLENADSQDWTVNCGGKQKQFLVHLWVTVYTHPTTPKQSTEVLYWVTDLSDPAHAQGTGTTVWFNVDDPSALSSLDVSQSVDNDTAGLYLTLTTRPQAEPRSDGSRNL